MKPIILCLSILLVVTINSFSQIPQKKEMEKKQTDTIPKVMATNKVLPQSNIIKTAPTNTAKPVSMETKKTNAPVSAVTTEAKKEKIIVVNENKVPIPADLSKATLLDAFFKVETGANISVDPFVSSANKDPDTHWSCGTFDQNENPVTSFHDDSDNDEYREAETTGPLKMHMDRTASFGDFSNTSRLHINIAPNGNDTWVIDYFTLTLDFLSPKFSQQITWKNITLSQDKRDIDLYFIYDGKNLVPRQ